MNIRKEVFGALDNIIQPAFASFLNTLLKKKYGEFYWNDYVKKAIFPDKWQPRWNKIEDMDIAALCQIAISNREMFSDDKDDDFGNLYDIRNRIYQLRDLRNKLDHNNARNINEVCDDDLFELVSFLNIIKSSEECKDHLKAIIAELFGKLPSKQILPNPQNSTVKQFKEYLIDIAYKEKGEGHYGTKAANSYASAVYTVGVRMGENLWHITDSKKIYGILDRIRNLNWFLDGNSHNCWSNGLKRYAEFLDYQKGEVKVDDDLSVANTENYRKAINKFPRWANNPQQYNATIVWAYFKAKEKDGCATRDKMKKLCNEKGMTSDKFEDNYASMKTDKAKNHGKVFEDDGKNVWIWKEVENELLKYKEDFLNNVNNIQKSKKS